MTQSSLQTQCPNCKTRFRVTEDQLGIAKGKVRCGNCMDVFNAIEHQVIAGATTTTSPQQAPATENSNSQATEDDILFADNPEEDAVEGRYAGSKLTFSEDELSDSFRTVGETDAAEFGPVDDDSQADVDESWAEAILDDTEPTASSPEAVTETPPPSATREPDSPKQRKPEHELAPEPVSSPAEKADQPFPLEESEVPEDSFWSEPDESFFEQVDHRREFDLEQPEDQTGTPMTATLPFNDLRRDPVAVNGGGGGKLRTLLWSTVVLALIGVLVAQVTWFQFDRLSAIPELRPFYEQGCELAGCTLKPLINVEAIQSRKLVVRTDPESRMQLVVDAVIINRADFAQPFPAIALTFSNLNGDVVAQSVFTPEEYLAGEGRALDTMPQDTPVRIAINIRDPGRDAVNYNLNFRPYTP